MVETRSFQHGIAHLSARESTGSLLNHQITPEISGVEGLGYGAGKRAPRQKTKDSVAGVGVVSGSIGPSGRSVLLYEPIAGPH